MQNLYLKVDIFQTKNFSQRQFQKNKKHFIDATIKFNLKSSYVKSRCEKTDYGIRSRTQKLYTNSPWVIRND